MTEIDLPAPGTQVPNPDADDRGRMRRSRSGPVGLKALVVAIAALFAAPFIFLVARAAGSEAPMGLLTSPATLGPLGRSVLLGTTVSVTTAAIGTFTAWVVARTDVPGRRGLAVLLPLPLVIPSFIGAFALIAAFATGGLVERILSPLGVGSLPQLRGFWGAFVVLTLLTYPYVHLPTVARLRELPPSLEEAARLSGRPPLAVFFTVVLPQIRGAVLAGTLLVFLYAISDFGAVQLLRYDTLTRAIYARFQALDEATSIVLSLHLGVLAVIVVALERLAVRGAVRSDARRSLRGLEVPLGGLRALTAGVVGSLLVLALFAPIAVLTFWAARGLVHGTSAISSTATTLAGLLEPALRTAGVSIATAAVAVLAVAPVAYLSVRHRSRIGSVANTVIVSGFALPGLAVALSLVFWTLRSPGPLGAAYQTVHLLVFAYVVHFGAQALRAGEVAVASVPLRIDEAARSLGAGRTRRLFTVDLPLMTPGLLAGGGLVLLSTMKELPATLLLAPAGFETLATRIWSAAEDAYLAEASVASLVLIVLSGVLTWVLVIRRSEAVR